MKPAVTCEWFLNTQVLFLKKGREPSSKDFDDHEWLNFENGLQDVPEDDVQEVGAEVAQSADAPLCLRTLTPAPSLAGPSTGPVPKASFQERFLALRKAQQRSQNQSKTTMHDVGASQTSCAQALARHTPMLTKPQDTDYAPCSPERH